MTDKKKYYTLDEIGFIGTQNRTPAQVKKDAERTVAYIKSLKSGKAVSEPKRKMNPASKAK